MFTPPPLPSPPPPPAVTRVPIEIQDANPPLTQLTIDSSSPQTPCFDHLSCSNAPPLISLATFPLFHDLRCGSFVHGARYMASSSGVEGDELGQPGRRRLIPSANDMMISLTNESSGGLIARYGDGRPAHSAEDERRARVNVISGEKEGACRTSLEIIDSEHDMMGGVVATGPKLSRDNKETWAAALPCYPILPSSSHRDGSIYKDTNNRWKEDYHIADRTEIEVYGYIAVWDNLDPLLNYVFNCSRDDPIIIEQGSLLNMTGPKRAYLNSSVEATVEVVISEVQGRFKMCLDCFSSGLHEEIRLFDGAISESHALKRSVVAVVMDTQLDLKFKLRVDSSIPAEHRCSFNTNKHGRVTEEIKTDFALISVKVTWSTLPDREWPTKFLA
ncbi:hypothetical protein PR202_ga05405 [Eleusine coracana subsp. coracana]|uniref:DUF6598 domain-containing protein n=1 Tax=Eleusine coracana subsp. coracana TaxID=191504 RepID=A0AAV5BT21_ELECO|nr:hypothetical protein PR202_ga04952 [Eleusine coracana subsp. coracana]GJM89236.1 hypothetical protein PR202_ga05405 [Eleusine coracana subsp. coracana]